MPSSTDDVGHTRQADSGARGYETRDANTTAVLAFLAVLFVVLNLVLFGTWRLFRHFSVADAPPPPASSFTDERQLPPEPQLQVTGPADFQKIYDAQQQELQTYGWVDRQAGTVRLPIDRAMDLLVQKGVPVLPAGSQAQPLAQRTKPAGRAVAAELPGADVKNAKGVER